MFIPTTKFSLFHAEEINHLFNDSPLKNLLWEELWKEKVLAERQYWIEYDSKQKYILDFAIFCKNGKICIECDGDSYHLGEKQVKNDKKRNNYLETEGWKVLRYTTENLTNELPETVLQIKKNVYKFGGLAFSQTYNMPIISNQTSLF